MKAIIHGHFYADDSQLYAFFYQKTELRYNVTKLENCIQDIRQFMRNNFLKLNDEKSEVLLLGSNYNLKFQDSVIVKVGSHEITSSQSVRNLGSIFNSNLSMDNFMSSKCQSAMYFIRSLYHIRRCLDPDTTRTLVNALVTSRLDFANSLLLGATETSIAALQRVQNQAARLITGVDRKKFITPILKELHWLPVKQRIKYKLLTICYKYMQNTAPEYLSELLTLYKPKRVLRSSYDDFMLVVPSKNSKYGDKCFSLQAPLLWNELPHSLRSAPSIEIFKKDLKTVLFTQYYG